MNEKNQTVSTIVNDTIVNIFNGINDANKTINKTIKDDSLTSIKSCIPSSKIINFNMNVLNTEGTSIGTVHFDVELLMDNKQNS